MRELAAAGVDWRSVVDGLRPHTAALWRSLSLTERRRFLARLRPFWEVHRHRMAFAVAEQFRALLDRGDVRVMAGRVESAQADGDGVKLMVHERSSHQSIEWHTAWVINCTGPVPSNSVESNPVIGSLLVSGWLRPDELALGIETTVAGNALATDGHEVADLFIVGTLRKPASGRALPSRNCASKRPPSPIASSVYWHSDKGDFFAQRAERVASRSRAELRCSRNEDNASPGQRRCRSYRWLFTTEPDSVRNLIRRADRALRESTSLRARF